MTPAHDSLTNKEKETLRLIARGHDAKSAANNLDLSVHTINERLRNARRKLGVTSSREAARILHDLELEDPDSAPKKSAYKQIRDANPASVGNLVPTIKQGRNWVRWIGGIAMLSVFTFALVVALPGPTSSEDPNPQQLTAELVQADPAAEKAARDWLALVDVADWQASFDAAGAAFREPNTVEGWQAASHQVRTPLGAVTSREVIKTEFVNAPPKGFMLVRFMTRFESNKTVIESVTLEREVGGLKVVGYLIE